MKRSVRHTNHTSWIFFHFSFIRAVSRLKLSKSWYRWKHLCKGLGLVFFLNSRWFELPNFFRIRSPTSAATHGVSHSVESPLHFGEPFLSYICAFIWFNILNSPNLVHVRGEDEKRGWCGEQQPTLCMWIMSLTPRKRELLQNCGNQQCGSTSVLGADFLIYCFIFRGNTIENRAILALLEAWPLGVHMPGVIFSGRISTIFGGKKRLKKERIRRSLLVSSTFLLSVLSKDQYTGQPWNRQGRFLFLPIASVQSTILKLEVYS